MDKMPRILNSSTWFFVVKQTFMEQNNNNKKHQYWLEEKKKPEKKAFNFIFINGLKIVDWVSLSVFIYKYHRCEEQSVPCYIWCELL